ncbi:MAG TPA: RHS repeat domain-containing protein [Candidatus Saccharimonadales bacterium]|nr:RHS repeat domain-containing protein [Candidatus Saccharimonadales bacterium]
MSPYAYNSSNQLTSTHAGTFTCDGNGNTLSKVNSTGTTEYETRDQPDLRNYFALAVAGITGPTSNFTVNSTVQVTDALGHGSSYTSAMVGGNWYMTDAQGSGCSSCTVRGMVTDDLDTVGNLLGSTDELGHRTSFVYDANGNVRRHRQPHQQDRPQGPRSCKIVTFAITKN